MSTIRASLLISLPPSMGVNMESIMTCPISSMMTINTRLSRSSVLSFPLAFRIAITTAVLEPEMTQPRVML